MRCLKATLYCKRYPTGKCRGKQRVGKPREMVPHAQDALSRAAMAQREGSRIAPRCQRREVMVVSCSNGKQWRSCRPRRRAHAGSGANARRVAKRATW